MWQNHMYNQKWLEWHERLMFLWIEQTLQCIIRRITSTFSRFLNSIVNGLRQMSPSKRLPLVTLHTRRVKGGPVNNPNHKKILDNLQRASALYATPVGSNDDWYWLYAAVHFKSLLVTNDEMRDHLFPFLATNFFPRWKEKHQILQKRPTITSFTETMIGDVGSRSLCLNNDDCCLMLFNDAQKLSFQDIKESTGIEDKELRRTLQSLACGKVCVLQKFPKGRDVEDNDTFVFNEESNPPLYRIKVNEIQMKKTVVENTNTT